jgi:hypothetical protein
MITAKLEATRAGAGDFTDAQVVEFCDGEHELFGLLRIARLPGHGRAEVLAVMFAGGDLVLQRFDPRVEPVPDSWQPARAGGARWEVLAPLERWGASYRDGALGFELEMQAASSPIDWDEPPYADLSRMTGMHGFEQLCTVRGTAFAGERSLPIQGTGRRVRTWGASKPGAARATRSLYAAAGDSALTVASVRPALAETHDQELLAGHLLGAGLDPLAFEQIRLSTVYDGDGRPREAGLELLAPGEEMPRRVAGEATCGVSLEAGDAITSLAFFRWSVEGVPGYGSYQLHQLR